MGETSRNVDMEELITYSNNLVQILKSDKDINDVKQFLQKSQALQSQTDKDFYHVQKSIQGSNFYLFIYFENWNYIGLNSCVYSFSVYMHFKG